MELAHTGKRFIAFAKKYRYVLLILALGIVLMLLPSGEKKETEPAKQTNITKTPDLAEELAEILAQIHGAGRIKVLLTSAAGEETVYQTDLRTSADGESQSEERTTVKITNSDRSEVGLIRQVIPPKYQGAVVVCQGADLPSVRLAIVEAVSDATGLGVDKISVIKMK